MGFPALTSSSMTSRWSERKGKTDAYELSAVPITGMLQPPRTMSGPGIACGTVGVAHRIPSA
eukprot:1992083-Rhodomonas_salina.1